MFSNQTIVMSRSETHRHTPQKRAAMNRTVKAMLVKQGITQAEIAQELNVTRSAISSVLNGHSNSQRIKDHIAKKLGKDYEKVWGKAG